MERAAMAVVAAGLVTGSMAVRAAAAEPTAAEVVARSVAARGGLEAWRKVETMVWIGHVESAHAPVPGLRFELEQKRPNRTRLQVDAMGERSVRVFDGARGWKVRQVHGRPEAQPYTAQEVEYARASPGLDGPLIDLAAKGSTVALAGVDEVEGRAAYHLRVRPARGPEEDVWVDAETYLEVREDRQAGGARGGAPRRVSVTFGDWRNVDGVQVPFLVTTGGGPGATPDRMRIERAVLNAPLDDAAFANPAAPLARHRLRGAAGPRARAGAGSSPARAGPTWPAAAGAPGAGAR